MVTHCSTFSIFFNDHNNDHIGKDISTQTICSPWQV
jgi:hypothetical protein